MFNNTFNNLKSIFKKGGDLVKTATIGTITALKDDISLELKIHKELKEYRKELYELVKEREKDATRARVSNT